jgi:DNA-binding MarR family transcriptional regulator
MSEGPDVQELAGGLRVSIGLLFRRHRQLKADGELTLPESSALARLDRGGPATSSVLARLEQISPQSMGTTVAGLEVRGLVERHRDPDDGRRVVLSVTAAGRQLLRDRRDRSTQAMAQALSTSFTSVELDQLMTAVPLLERLAQSI